MESTINQNKSKSGNTLFQERIRSASMARRILPYRPLPATETTSILSRLLGQEATTTDRVIYVHIPFCKHICPFCIYSKQIPESAETVKAYCETLLKQIQSVSSTVWAKSAPFKAVFFGGGTPTFLPAEQLTAIVSSIKKHYPLTPDCEITVESTISEITPEYCSKMKEAGVNRISLGVQSFNTEIRKKLGRAANTEKILEALNTIKESGFSNIAIDLIYMLEGQTMETWKRDLQLLASSPITGCSVYPLITIPGSSKVSEDLKQEYRYFSEADKFLAELNGWQRFTPVQYGHSVNGTAKYVTSHGKSADSLAFGAGAGGRIQNFMYLQNNTAEAFIKTGSDLAAAPMIGMKIDEQFLRLRNIYGLSEGLQLKKSEFEPLAGDFSRTVQLFIEQGFAESSSGGFGLTQLGRFWAANISALFSEEIKRILLEK